MTEDEAFIRTIVDSPGDDLPRMVYADWLDERNDPRGAYLRAEAEWAKTKQLTGFLVLWLNGLAEGLDPVWVGRVSRPPVGVCADHVGFREAWPGVSAERLDAVELAAEIRLPTQFRALLQNVDGGIPTTDRFPHPDGSLLGPLRRFVWCGESSGFDLVLGIVTWRQSSGPTRRDMFPVCQADWGDHSVIAIGCSEHNSGAVYLVYYNPHSEQAEPPTLLAETLSTFLASLTTANYDMDDDGIGIDFLLSLSQ